MTKLILIALIGFLAASSVRAENYASWLSGFQERAIRAGLDPIFVRDALSNLHQDDSVIALDQKQPEGYITLEEYVQKTITPERVRQGRAKLTQYNDILAQVTRVYGVPPSIIVALWGKETDFGGNIGKSRTISSLATLAYEGRRRDFFEKELLNALQVMRYTGLSAESMRGSWAGAVGQCQFMPSNYLKYGVDGNKNGRVDLWREMTDVFPSMANMLANEGWQPGAGWGQKIQIPAGFDKNLIGRDKGAQEFHFWEHRGVRFNSPVPSSVRQNIRLYQPDGADGPAYAVYPNFDVLMRWNHSGYFAVAIGRLADEIAAANQNAR